MEETFKTEVIFPTIISKRNALADEIKLPASINSVSLRESFLSEAPFVTSSNRTFWRRMVDQESFRNILAASYYIVSDCISDSGIVNLDKLLNFTDTPYSNQMSVNLADMYFSSKLRSYDQFFLHVPEILSFMLICAIRTSTPKHHRLCQAAKFREILLDWCSEIIGGIRFTNCKTNREWLFNEVLESQILVVSANTSGPSAPKLYNENQYGSARTKYSIGLSPLIDAYIGKSRTTHANISTTLSMSHPPNRLPFTINTQEDTVLGKPRFKKMDYSTIKDVINITTTHRKQIINELNQMEKNTKRDLFKIHKKSKSALRALELTAQSGAIPPHLMTNSGNGVGVNGVSGANTHNTST